MLIIYVICSMNKLMVIGLLFLLGACKDEINLPETDSYVDGTDPIFTIISPAKNAVYENATVVPIKIVCSDDYELAKFEFDIQVYPANDTLPGLSFTKTLQDSTFTYEASYPIPTTDSVDYEVYIKVTDLVGNSDNLVYFITTK